jgi:hypothetical protein
VAAQQDGPRIKRGAERSSNPTPLLNEIGSLNERINEYDRRIEKIAKEKYPDVELLEQVNGVDDLIALTYVLTIEDPHRFPKGCK